MPYKQVLAVCLLLAASALTAAADTTVLTVDRVGEPDVAPAADILSLAMVESPDGPHLRLAFLHLGTDLSVVAPTSSPDMARLLAPVPVQVTAAGRTLLHTELRPAGGSFECADRSAARRDRDALLIPVPADLLAGGRTVFTATTTGGESVTAAFPPDRDIDANCALVLHGNQGLGYTDVFHGRDDDLEGSGFDEALQIHESTSIPVNVHLSGTLMTAADWAHEQGDPQDFNGWLADGVTGGWVGMLTSAYAQHIMPFVRHEMNDWAVHTETQMVIDRYGYTPTVGWVPERVWLYTSGYPSSGVSDWIGDNWQSHGVGAVILDDDVHITGHDNHQIHTSSSNGLRLVPRDRSFTGNIIGGNGQAALDILTAMAGSGVGQYRIAVFAEDWEAVAEMGGWADIVPNAKETYDWFVDKCQQESAWLATWKLADAVANPDFTGATFDPTPGTYWEIGGTDGYGGSDNSWYTHWAGWVPYANGGDGNGNCAGGGGNCKDYGTLWNDACDALMAAPDNNISQAGWYVLMTMLYETGWHDGLGGPISGWEHNYSGHIKQANIYAEAARWADGQYLDPMAAYFVDIDDDGYDEAIIYNERLFAVFEGIGGRCTNLFVKGPGYDDTAIGIDNAYWSGTTADYNDDNHVGAFSDVGPNYQHELYTLEILDGDATDGEVVIRATHNEVDKEIALRTDEPWLEATYRVGATQHWVKGGWSPSLVDLVWNADMERVWSAGRHYMGQHNPNTGLTVAWNLGWAGASHQGEFAATLMKGDEFTFQGAVQVRLYAGVTSAPSGGEVAELDAAGITDVLGPRVEWATWHPQGQLKVYFDQIVDPATADVSLMGFDEDGDGVPEVELDGHATVTDLGPSWYILASVDPATADAINALEPTDLQMVFEAGAIEDTNGNPGLASTGPVTAYAEGRVVLDGLFDADEWTDFQLDDAGDSQWTADNEIEALHVTWDEMFLYVGIEGIVHGNSWLLYLDTDPDGPEGETDLTAIDAWERGAVFTAPGFRADWQLGSYQHQSPYDGQTFWRILSATETDNATGNVQLAFDPDHLNGLDGGTEVAIPWETLYGMGDNQVPPGTQISLVASICWDPEPDGVLGGDSAPSNVASALPVIDNVWTIVVDDDGDGHPDDLDPNAAPDVPAGGLTLHPPYPNPFNPAVTLAFDVPAASDQPVRLSVFDARGRLVRVLVDHALAPGRHAAVWRGHDRHGRAVAAGTYFCRLEQAGRVSTRVLTLVK